MSSEFKEDYVLKRDARAKIDDWVAWVTFIDKVWKYFKKDETFGGDDIDWFVDTLVRTFRINPPKEWDRLGDQLEIIINYVMDNKDDPSWQHILSFSMMIIGLIELIRGLED